MKKHDIAELAIMLLGMFFLVQTLPFLLVAFVSGQILTNPLEFIPAAVSIIIGLGFIFSAGYIAGLLVRRDKEVELYTQMSFGDWQTLFISIIGIVTFLRGLGSFVSNITMYARYWSQQGVLVWSMIISPIIQIVLGAALFVKAQWIAEFWHSMQRDRTMGPVEGG